MVPKQSDLPRTSISDSSSYLDDIHVQGGWRIEIRKIETNQTLALHCRSCQKIAPNASANRPKSSLFRGLPPVNETDKMEFSARLPAPKILRWPRALNNAPFPDWRRNLAGRNDSQPRPRLFWAQVARASLRRNPSPPKTAMSPALPGR